MAHSQEELEQSKDVNSCANFDLSVSFVNNFTVRKNLFATDQEIFIDSQHPLILLNDTNANTPVPLFLQPAQQQKRIEKTSEKKEEVSQILSELELESPGLKKANSSPRKSILKTRTSSPSRRRDQSQGDSKGRRESNSMSNPRSDTLGGKEMESELMSPSKSGEEEEVDIFHNKDEKVVKESNPLLKRKIRDFLDSVPFNVFIGILTLYALFAQDLCEAVFEAPQDLGFDIMSLIAMGFFALEMLLTIYSTKDYLFSFFFWLDLISTISILFDIEFIINEILFGGVDVSAQANKNSIAGTIGSKAGRVFRVVRLIRLVKLYKQFTHNREIREAKKRLQQIVPEGLDLSQAKPDVSMRKDFSNHSFEARAAKALKQRTSILALTPADGTPISPLKARGSNTRGTDYRGSRLSRGFDSGSNKDLDKSPSASGLDMSMVSRRKSVRLTRLGTIVAPPPKEIPQDLNVKESRVGKMLSELTTKRVIIMVLALLLFIPMFQADFYFDPPNSQTYQMELLKKIIDSGATAAAKTKAVALFISQQQVNEPPLVFFQQGDTVLYSNPNVDVNILRSSEGSVITVSTSAGILTSIVSERDQNSFDSWLGIGRTLFIGILLTFGALAFNKDARDLILQPLERIIQKVNKIAKNPLMAKDEELVRDHSKGFDNETIHIENAIVKIGGLLALGFGDAGSAIIAQNIAKSGDINPMLPGKKKAAIYGFCDIRNFTDATEVLQEDVMVFVNSIADVVHSMVDKFTGQANKNIGDAFLLVWKFPEDSIMEMSDGQLEIISNQVTVNTADCALISFLKIYARINRDPALLRYRENLLLNARLPGYKVKMGFGLHLGWAIEGAIGSEFKIDASYLSPNVNMASRLEAATKQYGVPLLFSGDLYEMMSEEMQNVSRMIDVVTVKGSIKPIELYTVDMDVEGISIAKDRAEQPKELRKVRQKQKKDFIKEMVENDYASSLLETDKELKYMLRNKNEEFDSNFNAGFDAYIDGDWSIAKKKFETCLAMRSDDGPTRNLMGFLGEYDFICPEDWSGYHVLTEK